jgi:oligoribonuclease NrnB/cAMP/cGMP phosphodiesterase (DHH superfamily)
MKPIVIYHKNCADGVAAAWCFWNKFKDSMEYYEGVYGNTTPDITDRDVYLVDFSYKRDVVETICKFANNVILIDHHISALEDLWDLPAKYDNFSLANSTKKHSGARLAWDYVKSITKHDEVRPRLLNHVEDRDLWKFELQYTREIMMAVFSYPLTIEMFDELQKYDIQDLIAEGRTLLRKQKQDIDLLIKTTERSMEIGDVLVKAYNVNYFFASDLGDIQSVDQPFIATYYDTKNSRVFSLRSKDTGFDVSKIAAIYGGGGHRNAAGFKVDRSHPLACC